MFPNKIFILILSVGTCRASDVTTRLMYDSMARLVGDSDGYPESWWMERQECFNSISPTLIDSLDLAWQGMVQYWEMGGQKGDLWDHCGEVRSRIIHEGYSVSYDAESAWSFP